MIPLIPTAEQRHRPHFTTPQPVYPPTAEVHPPAPLHPHEKMRLRAAAYQAVTRYPGPVGELIARELLTWEEFGYRLDNDGLVMRLVNHLTTPPPVAA